MLRNSHEVRSVFEPVCWKAIVSEINHHVTLSNGSAMDGYTSEIESQMVRFYESLVKPIVVMQPLRLSNWSMAE